MYGGLETMRSNGRSPTSANRSESTNSTRRARPRRWPLRRATASAPGSTSAATRRTNGSSAASASATQPEPGADVEGERLVLGVGTGDGHRREDLERDLDQRLRLGPGDEHSRASPRGRWCGTRAGRGCTRPVPGRPAGPGAPRTGRPPRAAAAVEGSRKSSARGTSSALASSSSASRRGERDPLARSRWQRPPGARRHGRRAGTVTPRRRPPAACAGLRPPAPR